MVELGGVLCPLDSHWIKLGNSLALSRSLTIRHWKVTFGPNRKPDRLPGPAIWLSGAFAVKLRGCSPFGKPITKSATNLADPTVFSFSDLFQKGSRKKPCEMLKVAVHMIYKQLSVSWVHSQGFKVKSMFLWGLPPCFHERMSCHFKKERPIQLSIFRVIFGSCLGEYILN